MDDEEVVEPEVLHGNVHRLGGARRLRQLHFKAKPLASGHRQQIEFRSGLGLPEP